MTTWNHKAAPCYLNVKVIQVNSRLHSAYKALTLHRQCLNDVLLHNKRLKCTPFPDTVCLNPSVSVDDHIGRTLCFDGWTDHLFLAKTYNSNFPMSDLILKCLNEQ